MKDIIDTVFEYDRVTAYPRITRGVYHAKTRKVFLSNGTEKTVFFTTSSDITGAYVVGSAVIVENHYRDDIVMIAADNISDAIETAVDQLLVCIKYQDSDEDQCTIGDNIFGWGWFVVVEYERT